MLDTLEKIIETIDSFFNEPEGFIQQLVSKAMTGILDDAVNNALASEYLAKIYQALIPVALILMMIHFAMKLMEMVTDEQITLDKMLKHFIIMLIVIFSLDTGIISTSSGSKGWIIEGFNQFSEATNGIMDVTFSDTASKLDEHVTDAIGEEDNEEDKGFFYWLTHLSELIEQIVQTIVSSLLIMLLSIILGMILYIYAYYRAIRMAIYICLAPIGIAMCYTDSLGAIKYFKKLLAILLQGPIIILTTKVGFAMIANSTNTPSTFLITLIIACCLISQIFSSEQKARELVG